MATTTQETGRHIALVDIRVPDIVRDLDPEHVQALAGSPGRAGARCRRYRRSGSPTRPPNRTCPFPGIWLSTGHAVADWLLTPVRFRSAFWSRSTHAGVWQCRPTVASSGTLHPNARDPAPKVAPSFSEPLHQPGAGIPARHG
jgi:hypothetical protein